MKFNLSDDELKIIGSAIAWTLHAPFYRSIPPELSDDERGRLQTLFDAICQSRQEIGGNLEVTMDETAWVVRHIVVCLRAFHNEIGHSPTEVSAVTGLPISTLNSLLGRLSILN